MLERVRHSILGWWSALVCRHPLAVLLLAVGVAVYGVLAAVGNLGFQSDRNDLIARDLEWNQWFIDWHENFPGASDLVVVIEARADGSSDAADRDAAARRVVDELGPKLAADPYVSHVVWGFDPSRFSPRTMRLLPWSQFEQRCRQLAGAQPLLASPTAGRFLGAIAQALATQGQAADASPEQAVDAIAALTRISDAIGRVCRTPPTEPIDLGELFEPRPAPDAATADGGQWQYLTSANGRLLFISITPRAAGDTINALAPALESIRHTIDQVARDHRQVRVGLTGVAAIEADETAVATADTMRASIVAAVLIAALLVIAFHSFRVPLLAMLALALGIAWTFGFLTLAVGHLQVLSVVFTVILMGLGVAYGIHLAAGFELVRHAHPDTAAGFQSAMRHSFETIGPGVVTGAVTTAAAFMTTLATDFTGMAEMGLIAGVGVLLCLLAMFSVFPALLRLVKPGHQHFIPMGERSFHFFEERWVMPFVRRPKTTVAAACVLTLAAVLVAATQTRFDYDLLKLQPRNVASVELAQHVAEQGGSATWFGLSIVADLAQARSRAADFATKPTVAAEFGGVGLLIPDRLEEKLATLRQTRAQLGQALDDALALDDTAPPLGTDQLDSVPGQLALLRLMLAAAMIRDMPQPVRDALQRLGQSIDQAVTAAGELEPDQRATRLARLQRLYHDLRRQTAQRIDAALDTAPLELDDVPADLLRSYRDARGRLALVVYPQPPPGASPMDAKFLPRFVADLEKVDPRVTGYAVQIYRGGALILRAYILAGAYALGLVFLLVLIDFRSAIDALLALLPVTIGFAATFALMWLLGLPVNPANIIVLPLMFGIGVDSGVHMLHRYRQAPSQDPPGLTAGTGKGVTVTALTAIIGFGSLLLAHHRGIRSLGFVMTLGLALTMLACWTVMPAVLTLRRRHQH